MRCGCSFMLLSPVRSFRLKPASLPGHFDEGCPSTRCWLGLTVDCLPSSHHSCCTPSTGSSCDDKKAGSGSCCSSSPERGQASIWCWGSPHQSAQAGSQAQAGKSYQEAATACSQIAMRCGCSFTLLSSRALLNWSLARSDVGCEHHVIVLAYAVLGLHVTYYDTIHGKAVYL